MTIAISLIAMSSFAQVKGAFTDSRDGKVYKTVTIGTQTWMAENLAYKASSGCWAYKDDITNVAKYGYLYNWGTAKTSCPTGFHLPSDKEWSALIDNLGGEKVAGGKLKTTTDLHSPNEGADSSSGFTALLGGGRGDSEVYYGIGDGGFWWSSTESGATNAWEQGMSSGASVYRGDLDKSYGYSVRCLRDL